METGSARATERSGRVLDEEESEWMKGASHPGCCEEGDGDSFTIL